MLGRIPSVAAPAAGTGRNVEIMLLVPGTSILAKEIPMGNIHIATGVKAKLTAADLVNTKPEETFLWRSEMVNCSYDYVTQTRRWTESEKIRQLMMTTGAPTSSTSYDGEKDE
jgi:hypothetical protein